VKKILFLGEILSIIVGENLDNSM